MIFLTFKFKYSKKTKKQKKSSANTAADSSAPLADTSACLSDTSDTPPQKTEDKKETKKNRRYSLPFLLLAGASLVVFVVSLAFLIPQLLEYKRAKDESDEVKKAAVSEKNPDTGYLVIDYEYLKSVNGEFTCWLDVPGTNVSYPVVYPTGDRADNEYYLSHNFKRNSTVEGALFVDSRSPSRFDAYNVIIYGHRLNSGTMFTQLDRFQREVFWEDHKEVHLYTPDGILIYKVFSAYRAHVDDDCFKVRFSSDAEFESWAKKVAGSSNYTTGIVPVAGNATILLSTCVSVNESVDVRNNYRYVTLAVLVDMVENPARTTTA